MFKVILITVMMVTLSISLISEDIEALLRQKIIILENLNIEYKNKTVKQDSLIGLRDQKITILENKISNYDEIIKLKDYQIYNFKQINKLDSLHISYLNGRLERNEDKFYNNKYAYFIYGVGLVIGSSFVVRNSIGK